MRRTLAFLMSFLCLLLIAPAISAQDATPAPGSTPAVSLLAGLGYPDLVVTSDGKTNDLPVTLAAGRYHLVFHNTNVTDPVEVDFFSPPAGTSKDDVLSLYSTATSDQGPAPDLFYKLTIAGGALASPNGTADVIFDLPPGDWYAGFQIQSNNGPSSAQVQTLSVTGTMPTLTDPTVAQTATLADLKIELPDSVAAGPQIWKVTNAGSMPHFLNLEMSDGSLTQENVQATLGSFIGTPVPADVTPVSDSAMTQIANSGVLSPGQSIWIEVDLQPGQYLAACYLSGPGNLPVHAAMGMFKIFTAV